MTSQLKPEIKAGWLARLRGQIPAPGGLPYQQGTGKLYRKQRQPTSSGWEEAGGKFCCLGVLTDMMVQADPGYTWGEALPYADEDDPPESVSVPLYDPSGRQLSRDYLSIDVTLWAGLPVDQAPSYEVALPFSDRDGNPVTLVVANDDGCTFDQIADLIEHFL